jgi:hypothetical protein
VVYCIYPLTINILDHILKKLKRKQNSVRSWKKFSGSDSSGSGILIWISECYHCHCAAEKVNIFHVVLAFKVREDNTVKVNFSTRMVKSPDSNISLTPCIGLIDWENVLRVVTKFYPVNLLSSSSLSYQVRWKYRIYYNRENYFLCNVGR